ncbi:hypothetical protein F4678DRAFT_331048 [Xylaria arbuscula]|nr:hypothetical protein F4678DRAFT_331048 [Xylaria arbuscula]
MIPCRCCQLVARASSRSGRIGLRIIPKSLEANTRRRTLDRDGLITIDQLIKSPDVAQQSTHSTKMAVSIILTVVALIAIFYGAKGIRRPRCNNKRIVTDGALASLSVDTGNILLIQWWRRGGSTVEFGGLS